MIACLAIPGFELRAALRRRPRLTVLPAALAPAEGTEPLLGPVTAAAEAAGARPGMRLGEALALCPPLDLLPLREEQQEELKELGVRRLGELAGLPGGAVAERLGPDGRRAWSLARGGECAAAGRPRSSSSGSSSPKRSATSSRSGVRSACSSIDCSCGRNGSSASHARLRSPRGSSAARRGGGH